MKLKNRIAIVTGAARGIGLAIAEEFVKQGAKVVMADVLVEEGKEAAKKIGAEFITCDVSDSQQIQNLVDHVVTSHGAVDILVNNAGISIIKDFLEVSEDDLDRVITVNLKGAFMMLQACARAMVKQVASGRAPGVIVNMSSVNDTLAIPSIAPYTVSKGGVKQLTAVASVALAPHGIRVNAIGPGSIKTDMLRGTLSDAEAIKRAMSRTPLGRFGEPSEIATLAAFLASADASYITGQVIYADGGRMPLNYTVAVTE